MSGMPRPRKVFPVVADDIELARTIAALVMELARGTLSTVVVGSSDSDFIRTFFEGGALFGVVIHMDSVPRGATSPETAIGITKSIRELGPGIPVLVLSCNRDFLDSAVRLHVREYQLGRDGYMEERFLKEEIEGMLVREN